MIAVNPDVQRRNLILGLILGGFVLAMITTWVVVFTRAGLPKDPVLWKRMQEAATPQFGTASPLSPTAPTK